MAATCARRASTSGAGGPIQQPGPFSQGQPKTNEPPGRRCDRATAPLQSDNAGGATGHQPPVEPDELPDELTTLHTLTSTRWLLHPLALAVVQEQLPLASGQDESAQHFVPAKAAAEHVTELPPPVRRGARAPAADRHARGRDRAAPTGAITARACQRNDRDRNPCPHPHHASTLAGLCARSTPRRGDEGVRRGRGPTLRVARAPRRSQRGRDRARLALR